MNDLCGAIPTRVFGAARFERLTIVAIIEAHRLDGSARPNATDPPVNQRDSISPTPASAERTSSAFLALAWLPNAVLTIAAVVLTCCVAAGPQLYDSGELAAAAMQLGGSHPPGQPLHALLAHVFLWIPLGPIQLRFGLLSLGSALGVAWLAGVICGRTCELLGVVSGPLKHATQAATIAGVLSALPVLRQTLRIEVYTLALLLFLCTVSQLLTWSRDARSARLRAAAIFAGLAALVHPPHALAAALVGVGFGALQPRRLLASWRVVFGALISGLFPLIVLVYLPLRAHAGASMWGDPLTLRGFWAYVSGQAFIVNIVAHDRIQLLRDYGQYLIEITTGVPFVGALLSLRYAAAAGQRSLYGLIAACALALIAACLQPLEARNPDNVAYLAPCVVLAIIAGAAGFARLATAGKPAQLVTALALGLIALPPASARVLGDLLRADVPALEALTALFVESPPPRALVLVTSDFAAATWMMERSLEGARPDIALFVRGLATSSWHWKQLRAHPAFDGRPHATRGNDSHDRFARGVILSALLRVPVVLERELSGVHATAIKGPYLLLDPLQTQRPLVSEGAAVERWVRLIAREARLGPPGDTDAAAAVLRDFLCLRSLRLFQLGEYARALASVRLALWELPENERALVRSGAGPSSSVLPIIVDDPRSYLISKEDAVRQAAALLWALADPLSASTLLEHQLQREDPLALLQLAHLQASGGQRDSALRTLTALAPLLSAPQRDVSQLQEALSR